MRDHLDLPIDDHNWLLFYGMFGMTVAFFLSVKIYKDQIKAINEEARNSGDVFAQYNAHKQRQQLNHFYVPMSYLFLFINLLLLSKIIANRFRNRNVVAHPAEPVEPDYRQMGIMWGTACSSLAIGVCFGYSSHAYSAIQSECLQRRCSKEELNNQLRENERYRAALYRSFLVAGGMGMHMFRHFDKHPAHAPRWLANTALYLRIEKPMRQPQHLHDHRL